MEDVIDRLIVECDRKITRALKRLEEDDAKAAIAISVSEVTLVYDMVFLYMFFKLSAEEKINYLSLVELQTPEILELSKEIKEKLKEADQYGNPPSLCFFAPGVP